MNENAINIRELIEYNDYIAIVYDDITNPELPQYHICPRVNDEIYPFSLGCVIIDIEKAHDESFNPKVDAPFSIDDFQTRKDGTSIIEFNYIPGDDFIDGMNELYIEINDNIVSYRGEYDNLDSCVYVLDIIKSGNDITFIYEVIEQVDTDFISLDKDICRNPLPIPHKDIIFSNNI